MSAMNTSFETKTQASKRRASHEESKSSIAYPSRTLVHAKLEMTNPGDQDEQEADAVANEVVSGGKIARKISGGGGSSGIVVSRKMESRLLQSQGGGQPMPQGLRSMMEDAFGQDFQQVRLHTDSEAASISSSIGAKAFSHGSDIYFNRGEFAPETTAGQHLVAHELTHVLQGGLSVRRKGGDDSIDSEVKTDNTHEKVTDCRIEVLEIRDCIRSIKEYFSDIADDAVEELQLDSSEVPALISSICGVVGGIGTILGVAFPTGGVVLGASSSILGGGLSIYDNRQQKSVSSKNASTESLARKIKKKVAEAFEELLQQLDDTKCENGSIKYDKSTKDKIFSLKLQVKSQYDNIKENLKAQILAVRKMNNISFRLSGYEYLGDGLVSPKWDMGYYLAVLNGHFVTGGFDKEGFFHVTNMDFESSFPQENIIQNSYLKKQSLGFKDETIALLKSKMTPVEITYVKKNTRRFKLLTKDPDRISRRVSTILEERASPHNEGGDDYCLIERSRTISPSQAEIISKYFPGEIYYELSPSQEKLVKSILDNITITNK